MVSISILKNLIKVFFRTGSLREVINRLFYDKNKIVVPLKYYDYIVTKKGEKYYLSNLIQGVADVQEDYIFDDIKKSDIVVDIGASIGAFSIPVSKKAKKVFAIEPMTPNLIRSNIKLNKIKNIKVFDIALGDGKTTKIEWLGKSLTVKTMTLQDIKNICGGCDFLKIDCEGYEWNIKPEELMGIRRIEMELHKIGFPISDMEKTLSLAGFDYTIKNQPEADIGLWIIHAKRKST